LSLSGSVTGTTSSGYVSGATVVEEYHLCPGYSPIIILKKEDNIYNNKNRRRESRKERSCQDRRWKKSARQTC